MRKEKRLSRADGLEVLRVARDLIRDKKEHFMCLAIKSAGMARGVEYDVSAMEMIPELELFRPEGKDPDSAWFESSERHERLRILDRLITFYERNRCDDGVIDRIMGKMRSFFYV